MSLTEVELRSLDETAASLRRSNPRLARTLSRGTFRPRKIDVVTVVVGLAVLVTLTLGVALRLPVVCAVAWTAVIALTILRGMCADRGY